MFCVIHAAANAHTKHTHTRAGDFNSSVSAAVSCELYADCLDSYERVRAVNWNFQNHWQSLRQLVRMEKENWTTQLHEDRSSEREQITLVVYYGKSSDCILKDSIVGTRLRIISTTKRIAYFRRIKCKRPRTRTKWIVGEREFKQQACSSGNV